MRINRAFLVSVGNLLAHIDEIRYGIRDVAVPQIYLSGSSKDWSLIFAELKSRRIGFIVVDFPKTMAPHMRQIVLYLKGSYRKALRVKKLFLLEEKSIAAHRELGRLLGYSKNMISAFLAKHRKKNPPSGKRGNKPVQKV